MFSPEALKGLNTTYQAKRVSKKEALAWAKKKDAPWATREVAEAIETGEQLYLVDGDLLTERNLNENYLACDGCHQLVSSQPLTWGVMQYQEHDGSIECNHCFSKRTEDGAKVVFGIDTHWPRMGGAGITMDVFRHALDERIVEDALIAAGYEKVYETGVEGVGYGATPEAALLECQHQLAQHARELFIATRICWQFCSDLTLWKKGSLTVKLCSPILDTDRPEAESLHKMRRFADASNGEVRWASYQNVDLGHPDLGHLKFLAIGPRCTFRVAPERLPDTRTDINWRYYFCGWVDLATGAIERCRPREGGR